MIKSLMVGIPTYGRPQSLKKLLNFLFEQETFGKIRVEICVVDNDCCGESEKVISEFPNVTYVQEKNKGIVFARNKIVEVFLNTDHEALVFIDDDEYPVDDNWLLNLCRVQNETDADLVTGEVITVPENEMQKWVSGATKDGLKSKIPLKRVKKFYTGNLLIMRYVFEKVFPAFDKRFNESGSEDLHFCIRCNKVGFKAFYTNTAPVNECFFESRASLKWFFLRGYRSGVGATQVCLLEEGSIIVSLVKILIMFVLRLIRAIAVFSKGLVLFDKGIIANGLMRLGSSLGTICGLFGVSYKEYRIVHGR